MVGSSRTLTWSSRGTVLMLDGYTLMLVTVPVLNKTMNHIRLFVLDELTDSFTVLLATIPLILAPSTPEGSGTATEFAGAVGKR
jgi:hypothetical protein